jgi:D-apiose dehydrogenase
MSQAIGLGDRPLKVAVAGAGYISQFHLAGWKDLPQVEVVAVCDPAVEKARGRAEQFGVPRVYADFSEMLERERPDAVDIATSVATHAPLTRIAADRGVHVMVQKPMTPTVAEGEALVRDVGGRVRVMVHENFRFRPHYVAIRDWLAAGRIGEVRHARLTVRSSGFAPVAGGMPPILVRQPYLQGFPRLLIFEALIHHLDVLRSLLGPLTVTSATLCRINPALTGEDVATIRLCGSGGTVAILDGNFSAPGYPVVPVDRLEVVGSHASLLYDVTHLSLVGGSDLPLRFDPQANYQVCFTAAIRHFVRGLRTGEPFATGAQDNLEVLRLVEACYAAAGGVKG